MLQKMGKGFPTGKNHISEAQLAELVANALKAQLGAVKNGANTIERWTGVSNRTAKNWLAGTHAPSAAHLIQLSKYSDHVLHTLLLVAGRPVLSLGTNLMTLKQNLIEVVETIDIALGVDGAA